MPHPLNEKHLADRLTRVLLEEMSITPDLATDAQLYRACATVTRELLEEKHRQYSASSLSRGEKQVHYLCMEFLVGRSLKNNLYNLGLTQLFADTVARMGAKLEDLYEQEPDAGLGNGGLGRLAACYLDAAASLDLPATGYCILYEFGIFRQQILQGWQTEQPDYWLPGGEVWLTPRPEQAVEVRFGGVIQEFWDRNYHHVNHQGYSIVRAVPYDMYLPGYDSRGVSCLRLWKAESAGFDMDLFNKGDFAGAMGQAASAEAISKVLYPNDNHREGKSLRLRQQYFLVSASLSDIVHKHVSVYGEMDSFPRKNAIHINDTHPTLAIPELMRILLDEYGYPWEKSWEIVTATFAYTNHTVLSEALERWNEDLMRTLLPRIYQIIYEINTRFCIQLREQYHRDEATIQRMSIIYNHEIHMARLCVATCHSVNGVSALHSRIIREGLFADFCALTPQKFCNVTNGIASRRWLCQSNPGLSRLVEEQVGPFQKDFSRLAGLLPLAEDAAFLGQLGAVKRENKIRLSRYLGSALDRPLDPDSLFDVQVKRLHEYKRQHLNALHILTLYLQLKANPNLDYAPHTFVFGAKAAPGYYLAKQIIKFICTLRDLLDSDPAVRDRLRIVYLEDYRVTLAEQLMPAADLSEQISLAGKEASGTGNMKLMLNGALTIGTLDGANVEILEAVGRESLFLMGLTAPEVEQLLHTGYLPGKYLEQLPLVEEALALMERGFLGESFPELAQNLRYSDPFLVLADFASYDDARRRAHTLYHSDPQEWQRRSLHNIAGAGIFCADRAVEEYARHIWHAAPSAPTDRVPWPRRTH